MSWNFLDSQMAHYKKELKEDVKLEERDSSRLATTVSSEVRFLSKEQKKILIESSPVALKNRIEELKAFQRFMDRTSELELDKYPEITRSKVIYQSYICFLYLPESCFKVLAKEMPRKCVTRKCAKFLTNNPVRSFRNAVAHANWSYSCDFSGLDFWARKGAETEEPLQKFYVDQRKMEFWQCLSRCIGYAVLSNI